MNENKKMSKKHVFAPMLDASALVAGGAPSAARKLISQNVLINWFLQRQLPHERVNLSFTITDENIKWTILWGS